MATAAVDDDAYTGETIPKDVVLNLSSLVSVDEKLQSLADCLRRNTLGHVS